MKKILVTLLALALAFLPEVAIAAPYGSVRTGQGASTADTYVLGYLVNTVSPIYSIASGCGTGASSPASLYGNSTAGSFVSNVTSCAPVFTLPAAPNGWVCHAHDLTNTGDALVQTASTTTSCTESGTVSTSDVIQFNAVPY